MAALSNGATGQKVAGWGCLLFFALFWSSITLMFDVIWGWNVIRQVRALDYPTAVGTVTKSEVESHRGSKGGRTYSPKISYTYRVDGKNYTGDRYRYGDYSSSGGSAQGIVNEHPVGRKIDVHYVAADPADSVLFAGLEGSDLFWPMFMTPFNLIMLALWYAPFWNRRRPGSRVGNARLYDDGFETRLRLVDFGPIAFGAVVAAGLAFAGTFVVGFAFGGFSPPLSAMYVAWGVILGAGALACGWRQRRISEGQFDLVLENAKHRLTLPRTYGRTEPVSLDAAQVTSIEVEKVTKQGSKGRISYVYAPTLIIADSAGAERREKLVEWSDEARANELADWLRERLRSDLKPY